MDSSTVGQTGKRQIARVQPWCTGCGGAPVCLVYCRKNALIPRADSDHYPFRVMTVDESLCIGCGACVTGGDKGLYLSGCPWNAIIMIPSAATKKVLTQ